jgi:MoaA/NifB/PqqE/SkfB family radical SAM enzyme
MDSSIVVKGAMAWLGIRPSPISLAYELSWLCNLECAYCDRHTPMANEMTRDQILKALGEFVELGTSSVSLDGGEPLAHPNVAEIVQFLVEREVEVSTHTNGILVPRKIETIRKLKKVKISLDGPKEAHDSMRGAGSFDSAIAGARAATQAGVRVEFTCSVGRHNADAIEQLLDIVEGLGCRILFQPVRNSLFVYTQRDGKAWELEHQRSLATFARVEAAKRSGRAVANQWSSLRHFRNFPFEARPPCAAGWILCTMDPEGVLFHCGERDRSDRSNNVTRMGVAGAFANLTKSACGQCWCARSVEENYSWGLRFDKLLPPLRH